MIMSWLCLKANCYAVGSVDRKGRFPIANHFWAFLRSRRSDFSIPFFAIEQFDPRIPLKKSTFSTGCADRIARSKKLGSKRHFFDCVKTHDLVLNQKSPFSIHRSDCIRIGLKLGSDDSPLNGTYMTYALRGPAGNAICLLYTSPSPRDLSTSRMPSSA